jgi:hypothetical protein
VVDLDVVELMYKERQWDERIISAGEWREKSEKPKCVHGLFGLLGFCVGILVTNIIFIHWDIISDFLETLF